MRWHESYYTCGGELVLAGFLPINIILRAGLVPRYVNNGFWVKLSPHKIIRLIALFKLAKACLLIAVAVGAAKLLHGGVASAAEHWVEVLKLDPDNHYVNTALEKAADLTPGKVKALWLGSLIYAALFLTEGIGLWFGKRWAEWFTVIITSSLVPIEIYEIFHRITLAKIFLLLINIAIVVYLIYRIGRQEPHPS